MYTYHFHQWLSFFYFYCVFGWCFETTYVSLKKRKFINRGFMKGPWLPLYGTGAISVLFVTLPFQDHWYLVYFIGAIWATILEYFVGVSMLKLFKVRYWDYSNQKIQFQGQICLSSTLAWGGLSLLMVYVVHEPVAHFILGLNNDLVSFLTFLITVVMVFDFANAFRSAMDLRSMLVQAEQLRNHLQEYAELQAELLKASTEEKIIIMNARKNYLLNFYGDQLENKKYDVLERVGMFEMAVDKQILEIKEKGSNLIEKMSKPASHALLHNPGFKAPSLRKESMSKLGELILEEASKKRKKHQS